MYYVRAYAINSAGTGYGDNQEFTTCPNYSGNPVRVGPFTFRKGMTCEYVGEESIITVDPVVIETGASVTLRAPRVEIGPRLRTESGAFFHVLSNPP